MEGKLVVIEGLDGAGKSTLADRLEKRLLQKRKVLRYAEPGGTDAGEQIRWMLKNSAMPINDHAEALLFAAARAQLAEQIRLDLQAGHWVLLDRWLFSSVAYQGRARGLGEEAVASINRWAISGLSPDLWIYLRLSLEEAERRRSVRGEGADRIEQEPRSFFAEVSEAYEAMACEDDAAVVLSAELDPATLAERAWTELERIGA